MITIKTGTNFTVLCAFKSDTHTPSTGITPAITIYDTSDNSKIEDAESMTEVGLGIYKFTVTGTDIDSGKSYAVYVDGGATLTTYRYQYGAFAGNMGNEDTILIIDTKVDTVDGNVDEIETLLGTVDGKIDTIDGIVDAILEDTGTTLPAAIAIAGQGNGNKEVKFLVRDVAGVSAGGGCAVTIYADTGTTTQSTGTLYTDELGIVNVMLNAGTYYARAVKSGKTFPNPITITVNA
jgi:hypothetical protein